MEPGGGRTLAERERERVLAVARPLRHPGLSGSLTQFLPAHGSLPGALGRWLAREMSREVEERRGFLWLPVAAGIGIALYFAAEAEPSLPVALALAGMLAALAFVARARPGAFHVLAALAAIAAGFALATAHTARIQHPVLATTLVAAELSGFVERAERRGEGARIVLRLTEVKPSGRARLPETLPERARVSLRAAPPAVGTHVTLRATIGPPPGPAYPGGFDFGRDAWFEGIGATGYGLGTPRTSPTPEPPPGGLEAAAWLERLRAGIAARIGAVLSGEPAAVATALVTGLRGQIGEPVEEAMRVSGLSHILSISGLHMALVAMTAFFLVRAGLALSPTLALRHPIKAWAAVPAILAASFYLALSGNEVPTQRSYVMALLVLVGVMLGRPALTLRTLALAALIVLACAPATLLDPGTQMSFAATLTLVAGHERFGRRLLLRVGARDWGGMALRALLALALTSLLAGLATAPFAAYHFQRGAPYGLLANLLAIPLVSFVVMPAGLVGALLLPLGLDGPAWRVMGWGVEGVLAIAARVAACPGADQGIAAFPGAALVLIALSLVGACLLRTSLVLIAPILLSAALVISWLAPRPVLLVDAAGRTVAVRGADGRLALMGDRPLRSLVDRFAAQQWLLANGDAASLAAGDAAGPATPASARTAVEIPATDGVTRTPSTSGNVEPSPEPSGNASLGEPASGHPGASVAMASSPLQSSRTGAPSLGSAPTSAPAPPLNRSGACDASGCVLPLPDGRMAALSLAPGSLADDCRLAVIVITRFDPPSDCAALVIRTDPHEAGAAVAVYLDAAAAGPSVPALGARTSSAPPAMRNPAPGLRVVSARPADVVRPWLPAEPAKPKNVAVHAASDPATAADTQALPPVEP